MDKPSNSETLRLSNEESNRLTRECLRTAIMKLMGEHPLEKISVNDIVSLAGVSRMAFYRNYGTKEALADDLCMDLANRLEENLRREFLNGDRELWYQHFFERMYNNKDYLKILFSHRPPIKVHDMIERLFPGIPVEDRYYYIGRCGAVHTIFKEWYQSGMKESPEEMGSLCYHFLYPENEDRQTRQTWGQTP